VQAVLKRYVKPWVRDEPHVPGNEVAALRLLQGTAIPVPRLFGAELVATACDAPAVLMSRAAGRPRASAQVLAASIPRLAEMLTRIHAQPVGTGDLPPYARWYVGGPGEPPTWATDRGAWRDAIAVAGGRAPTAAARLIHRDYNPWNVLWRVGRISAVVDWLNACIGPPEIDVAHLRHNLAALASQSLADRFLAAWQAASGTVRYEPYWDILSSVEWLPDTPTPSPEAAQRHETFLLEALRRR